MVINASNILLNYVKLSIYFPHPYIKPLELGSQTDTTAAIVKYKFIQTVLNFAVNHKLGLLSSNRNGELNITEYKYTAVNWLL